MQHTAEFTLERGETEIAGLLEIAWSYSRGEFIEPGHPCNGYGRGWTCDSLTVTVDGKEEEITEAEATYFMERFHPDCLPDPRDAHCDDDRDEPDASEADTKAAA